MVDPKAMLLIFSSVFTAELGDKTQLATVCFIAGGKCNKKEVFFASSAALILSTLLAVFFGEVIAQIIPPHYLKIGAGTLFVIMGALFIWQPSKATQYECPSGSEK